VGLTRQSKVAHGEQLTGTVHQSAPPNSWAVREVTRYWAELTPATQTSYYLFSLFIFFDFFPFYFLDFNLDLILL
jgi:hypothetical protein